MQISNEKILGLIYGTALGDSYGMASEMLTREEIKKLNVSFDHLLPSFPNSVISKNQKAGSITDDTCNSLMIIKMLKDNSGKVEIDEYINTLVEWSQNSPIAQFVTGPSTSKALDLINKGMSIEETGKMGTTNGACMKIAPVGIYYSYIDLHSLVEAVSKICLPTHNTTIAISGASVIAMIASYALRNDSIISDELMALIYETIDIAKDYGNNWPSASLKYRIKQAIGIADRYTNEDEFKDHLYEEIGASFESIDTVPSVLAILKYTHFDINRFVRISASLGGDTDTIGAIGGAICGALNPGLINQNEIDLIESVNNIKFKDYL